MQATSWHHKLFHFHFFFWVGKCGKEGEKFEYLENENSFFYEIKNIFHSFSRAIIWWKNKNLIKIADTSFKQLRDKKYQQPNKLECFKISAFFSNKFDFQFFWSRLRPY